MLTLLLFALSIAAVVALLRRLHASRRLRSESLISLVPGPKPQSWIYGNLPQVLVVPEFGQNEFRWLEDYGMVYAIRGCFGQERLIIADPDALRYILSTNATAFTWPAGRTRAANVVWGFGNVLVASDAEHKYLRGLMDPWFSVRNIRSLLPVIKETAHKLVDRWDTALASGLWHEGGGARDISGALHAAILDILAEAIAGVSLNDLTGGNDLSRAQRAVLDGASDSTHAALLTDALLTYIPHSVFRLLRKLPLPAAIREYHRVTDGIAREFIRQARSLGPDGGRTFAGTLALGDDGQRRRLSDAEVAVQLRTVLTAGSDTAGSTLSWIMYHIAQMEKYQDALRREITQASTVADAGGRELDYDAMSLLNAMINEVLRFYTPLPHAWRTAMADCVVPLSKPIRLRTGELVSSIPIRRGDTVHIAIGSYHRCFVKSIWGQDAEIFRPERWLEAEPPCKNVALGPHQSLLTFLAGPRVCIGYRLALLEIQVFVTALVKNFIFSLPADGSGRVRAVYSGTLEANTEDGSREVRVCMRRVDA